MYLRDVGEKGLIRELVQKFPCTHPRVIKAIGDDTSVTIQEPGRLLLLTTDILIDGVHFSLDYTPPYLLGRKSLSISLSDISAMGGEPVFFLVSIALHPETEKGFIDDLYRGLKDCADTFDVVLIGGNTSSTKNGMLISTTVVGEVEKEVLVLRKGARKGDLIFVTGTLGDSAVGLEVLRTHGISAVEHGPLRKAVRKHLDPVPRLRIGRILAQKGIPTSMIDISDGLVSEIRHITDESNTGAVIEMERVPISDETERYLTEKDAERTLPLTGGEDYELLFTAPEGCLPLVDSIARENSIRITPVGRIVDRSEGVRIVDEKGRTLKLEEEGFEHFQQRG